MSNRRMFLYDEKAKVKMEKQVAAMFNHISNQSKVWDEIKSRLTDPEALYFCGFEMDPNFVKVGDTVDTKYGDEGKVISINHQDEKIEIKTHTGNIVKISSDRIAYISYSGLESVSWDDYFSICYLPKHHN